MTIADAIYDLQLTAADAPCVIAGDFNHCDLRKIIPSLRQYVSFPTRKNSTIDICYGNIPHAYKSYHLPPIGNSDHDTVNSYLVKTRQSPHLDDRWDELATTTWYCQVGSNLQAKDTHSLHHKKKQ